MSYGDEQRAWEYPVRPDPAGDGLRAEEVRWRPWPCHKCGQGATALDFLRHCQKTSGAVPKGKWDRIVAILQSREAKWLTKWSAGCSHSEEFIIVGPELARGSEHAVYLEEEVAEVIKVTLPGCYGDFNYLEGKRICQAQSTPLLYLNRLQIWRNFLGNSPAPIGVTRDGRIVTRQKFIVGEPPTQPQVDSFLTAAGLIPVRQNCFLWKSRRLRDASEIWVGDARDENFVLSEGEVVPIDIRLWWKTLPSGTTANSTFFPPGSGRIRRSR